MEAVEKPVCVAGIWYNETEPNVFVRIVKPKYVKRMRVRGGVKEKGIGWTRMVWNNPVPPIVNPIEITKSQSRKAKRVAMGPRKSRKHVTKIINDKQIIQRRTTNDWPALRKLKSMCAGCKSPLYVYARKLRTGQKILFNGKMHRTLLYCIWFFKSTRLDRNIVAKILHLAFSVTLYEQQRTRKQQFHAKCGCGYHLTCYQKRVAIASVCALHKKVFE